MAEEEVGAERRRPELREEVVEVWAAYAKDRFESIAARVDEVRHRARQLIAVVGLLIGFEVNLLVRVLLGERSSLVYLEFWALAFLLLALTVQIWLLFRLIDAGFRGHRILEPESPSVLVRYLVDEAEREARRLIGAYYAKSHDHFFRLSETLGAEVGRSTSVLARSLLLFLLGVFTLIASAAL